LRRTATINMCKSYRPLFVVRALQRLEFPTHSACKDEMSHVAGQNLAVRATQKLLFNLMETYMFVIKAETSWGQKLSLLSLAAGLFLAAQPADVWGQSGLRTLATARRLMVAEEIAAQGIENERLLEAMREIPREQFLPLN